MNNEELALAVEEGNITRDEFGKHPVALREAVIGAAFRHRRAAQ